MTSRIALPRSTGTHRRELDAHRLRHNRRAAQRRRVRALSSRYDEDESTAAA
jgi:hypothetical protein